MRLVLYKRGSIWWARGGRTFRRSTKHTDERKARLVANRWERELADPTHYRAHQATVASAIERWMSEMVDAGRNPATVSFYDQKARHVARGLGHVKLADIDHDRVLRYARERLASGAHRYSIHRELTALRLALKSAARAKEFGKTVDSVMPKWSAGYEPRTTWITEEQAWTLIRALQPGRGAAVAFILATTADYSTAFEVERSDVLPTTVLVRGTKSAARKREVPRVAMLAPLLAYALTHADGEGGLLLRPWPNMVRDVKAACRRAGVPPVTARDLRRSTATWLVRARVPFDVASKFLGHTTTIMLRKVYGQMDGEALRTAIDSVQPMYNLHAEGTVESDTADRQK